MKHFSPEKLTEAYLAALFFLLPLGLHRAYFDITETKTAIFAILALLYVLASLLLLLRERRGELPGAGTFAFLAFALLSILSSLLWGGGAAFLGADNRYQGVLVWSLYALSFLFCARRGRFGRAAQLAAMGALAAVSLLAVLQSFGLDPLSLWEGLRPQDRGRYLSTLGNVNFLGAYLALLLPLCAGLYCETGRRRLLPLLALSGCALLCGSDAGLAGAIGGLLLLYALCAPKGEERRRFGAALAVLGGSICVYAAALARFGVLQLSAAGRLAAHPAAAPLWAIPALLLCRMKRDVRRPWLVPLAVLALGVGTILLASLCPRRIPPELRDYLVLSPSWGSDRGAIWLHTLDCFRSGGALRQLFGSGSGALARYDLTHRLFADSVVDSAHNEYLHYLLTSGVLGLAAYLTTLCSGLRRGVRRAPALTAAVFGCALQAAVNIAQCATTPLLLMLLAVLCGGNDPCAEGGKQI